jgi:hypothetical protein
LIQPYENGDTPDPKMLELAVARLKQLSAHEIGHTIGLAHSYATSAEERSSVMDYPYPVITQTANGNLDFSNAYDDKIGEWDKWAITYGYGYPAQGQSESEFLKKTLEETYAAGYEFITDSDSRDPSGVHPRSHLWDNGASAPEELLRMLSLRKNKMQSFGLNAIRTGEPEAMLEEVFTPLFLMHRYQVEAATKLVGGMEYAYKIKGDNQPIHNWLNAADQKSALDALMFTVSPNQLEVPAHVLALIPPRPFGYGKTRETFVSRTGPIFDPIAPAESVVDLTFGLLFDGGRATRLHLQNLQNQSLPSLNSVLEEVNQKIFSTKLPEGLAGEIKLMTESKLVDHLIMLADNVEVSNSVRAIARGHLKSLKDGSKSTGAGGLTIRGADSSLLGMHSRYLADKIQAFLDLPVKFTTQESLKVPDGAPIGMEDMSCDFDF